MTCQTVRLPDGAGVAIFCGGRRRDKCDAANCTDPVVALCDWKLHTCEGGKRRYSGALCSMALCARHRHIVGPGKDLCPVHHQRAVREGLVAGDGAEKASS